MKLYKCIQDDAILTDKALKKGSHAGHRLNPYTDPKDHKVYKVAIGIPNESNIMTEAYDNHLINAMRLGGMQERWRYEQRNPRYEFSWFTAGRMLTQMAREKLMSVALEAGMDYLVMYDDDMLLPQDMVLRLIEDMEQHPEIDILAPLAFMRSAPHYAVMYTVKEGFDPVRKENYYINHWVVNYPKNKLVECDAVGFGAVIIKLSMVRRMVKPYFMSTSPTGEDILFCVNAKQQANARVFMDTRIKLGHMGDPILIDEDYYNQFVRVHGVEIPDAKYKYAIDAYDVTNEYNSLDR
jgi:hypothetical protein